jgi:hypothetical protein
MLVFFTLALHLVSALPLEGRDAMAIQARKSRKQSNTAGATANGAASKAKVSTAKDGSTIIDQTVVIKCVFAPAFREPADRQYSGLNMRFKVSAPATELVANGATGAGTLGLNVGLFATEHETRADEPLGPVPRRWRPILRRLPRMFLVSRLHIVCQSLRP